MSLKNLYNYECDKLLNGVELFRQMLPHKNKNASIHSGEEGIFVENLVTEFLRNSLPLQLEVSSGFVVSSKDINIKSGQIDIIIYDSQKYSPIMKYGDAVVIHDKALVAAISVKKNITRNEVTSEFQALSKIGSMCGKSGYPKPYLAVFALDIRGMKKFEDTVSDVVKRIKNSYPDRGQGWSGNEMVNDLIVLNQFIIKKKDWKDKNTKEGEARYIMCGGNDDHRNIYVQHLVHGIGKVFNEREGTTLSVLTDFPKIDFTPATNIDLCTDNRPYTP